MTKINITYEIIISFNRAHKIDLKNVIRKYQWKQTVNNLSYLMILYNMQYAVLSTPAPTDTHAFKATQLN